MKGIDYMEQLFGNVYRGKRILITGHTGFKGSWLTAWLLSLGADVLGYSFNIPTNPSNFEVLGLENKIKHVIGDTRNLNDLKKVFDEFSPEIVFHLAAQAITRFSYDIPQETFSTNMGGTVNVLECIRHSKSVKTAVMITSDKCYQNVEWIWGYRENDSLGGDDPYSASKACAEIASASYIKSFFTKTCAPMIATARAGNVVGGGDWALDRVVPDCARSFSNGLKLEIRNPKATRPWQHVLEPLSGYLWLGASLLQGDNEVSGEAFNFGPLNDVNRKVEELINEFIKHWGSGEWHSPDSNEHQGKKECNLLKLNCDKAFQYLNWQAVLSFENTIRMTADWYRDYYNGQKDMYTTTMLQIDEYANLARERRLAWVK